MYVVKLFLVDLGYKKCGGLVGYEESWEVTS